MQPIEWLMRAMTHLNIGAAMATLAFTFWSGQQILSGEAPVAQRMPSAAATHKPLPNSTTARAAATTTQEVRP